MAFLSINGIVIPISAKDTSRTPQDIGQSSRSQTGRGFRTRIAQKYKYRMTTGILSPRTADALRGLISGLGESYPFTDDLYSIKGAVQTDPSDMDNWYISEDVEGRFQPDALWDPFNLKRALSIIPRQNISDIIDTDTDSASWSSSGVGASTVDLSINPYILTEDVVLISLEGDEFTSGGTTVTVSRTVHTTAVPTTGGSSVPIVCSFYIYGQLGTNGVKVYANLSDDDLNSVSEIITITEGRWSRYEITYLIPPSTNPAFVTLEFSNKDYDDTGTIQSDTGVDRLLLIDAIQLEYDFSEATALMTDGDPHQGTYAHYSLACLEGARGATISFWWHAPQFAVADDVASVIESSALGSWEAMLRKTNSLNLRLTVEDQLSGADETVDMGNVITVNDWSLVSLVIREDRPDLGDGYQGDGPEWEVFVNGALEGTISPAYNYSPLTKLGSSSFKWIGQPGVGTLLSDLQIWPFAITATMALNLYDSNKPQGRMPELRCEGDFDEREEVTCLGKVTREEYVSVEDPDGSGDFISNAVRLTFELDEI